MPRPPKPAPVLQEYTHTCGVAACHSVCRAFGRRVMPDVVCSTQLGTDVYALRNAFEGVGLPTLIGRMDLTDLTYHLRRGRLVLVTVPVGRDGHWLVVHAVTTRRVSVHDPAEGYRSIPLDEFLPGWKRQDGGLGVAVGPG